MNVWTNRKHMTLWVTSEMECVVFGGMSMQTVIGVCQLESVWWAFIYMWEPNLPFSST